MKPSLLPLFVFSLAASFAFPASAGDPAARPSFFAWADFDGDGRSDALVVRPDGRVALLRNEGGGRLVDVSQRVGLSGFAGARLASWRPTATGERPALLLVGLKGELHFLRPSEGGSFVDLTDAAGLGELRGVLSASWIDVDGDGRTDLLLGGAGSDAIYMDSGAGSFVAADIGLGDLRTLAGGSADLAGSSESAPTEPAFVEPRPEEPPPTGLGGRGAPLMPGAPGTVVGKVPVGPKTQSGNAALFCADSLKDVISGACLTASTVATLGSLYPLSNELFVDGTTGFVGVNTTSPQHRFHVEGQLVAGVGSTASGSAAVVSGGADNLALGAHSTVAGGQGNEVANAWSTVSGGQDNLSFAQWTTIAGGFDNRVSSDAATVGGGTGNEATALAATVAGGLSNSASGDHSSVLGGELNLASGPHATVAGGINNQSLGDFSALGGGANNVTAGIAPTVAGGLSNKATGNSSAVGGGFLNVASGTTAAVVGGDSNTASGARSVVLGGLQNRAQGFNATVVGGFLNEAQGVASLAAGSHAKSLHSGSFVWADDQGFGFSTTAIQQFLVRAAGGVGITAGGGSMQPEAPLHVLDGSAGVVTANANSIAVFERSSGGFVSVLGPDGSSKGFLFGNATDPNSGGIVYDQASVSAESMQFRTGGNSTRVTILANGNVGVGTTAPSAKLEVAGIAKATSFVQTSDARLKRDVRGVEGAMGVLQELDGVSYEWDPELMADAPQGRHLGLLAQQVREVLPEAVVEAADGRLAVEYSALVPVLVEALKDKDAELIELRARTDRLEACLRELSERVDGAADRR